MADSKHIVLISSFLQGFGGYEKIVANTANLFAQKNNKITLLMCAETAESSFPLNKNVQIIQLPLTFGITSEGNMLTRKIKMFNDFHKVKKTLKELNASLIICSEYPYAIAAAVGRPNEKTRIISWEHTHFNVNIKNAFWRKLFHIYYPRLDEIICLNNDEKKLFSLLNKNISVIPNFVESTKSKAALNNKIILTIARLTAVKGITNLLQTAKIVLKQNPDWQWKIIGDGELKKDVTDFIEAENLRNKLILQQPLNHDIESEYDNASLYVMTSVNECFPMVLLEALSHGLPCLAFDCDTGPRHIIKNNEDGLLVEKENPEKLAEAISSLINNEEKRKKMGEKAAVNIQRFSPDEVYKLWEDLF